jgi:FKBP-type peptidyl-prolyl cis-trans isomerase FkpA
MKNQSLSLKAASPLAIFALCSLALAGASGCKRRGGRGGARASISTHVTPTNDEERTLYALGLMLGQRVNDFHLTPHEIGLVQRGMTDQLTHQRPVVELETFGPRIGDLATSRSHALAGDNKRLGQAYEARAAQEPGAVRTESGLVFIELAAGSGPSPNPSDEVTVHYTGKLIDGTVFDSSRRHNQPANFQLNGVIPCWTEGVARMHQGGRARLVCPADIAYGDRGRPSIPPGSTLDFEVELISIRSTMPTPPPTSTMPTMPTTGGTTMPTTGGTTTTTTTTTTTGH